MGRLSEMQFCEVPVTPADAEGLSEGRGASLPVLVLSEFRGLKNYLLISRFDCPERDHLWPVQAHRSSRRSPAAIWNHSRSWRL